MPLRVLDSNGEGELWRVAKAILWAADHGADVINMSFSYPKDFAPGSNSFLEDVIKSCDGVSGSG